MRGSMLLVEKAVLSVAGLLAMAVSPARSQGTLPPSLPNDETHFTLENCDQKTRSRVWGEAHYLFWWIRNASSRPVVTTGDPNNPLAGVLDQPDTRPLFGGNNLDFGNLSGMKAGVGIWLDDEQTLGLEAGGFVLEQGQVGFSAVSGPLGSPPLVVPFTDPVGNLPTGAIIASPVGQPFAGGLTASVRSQLWGAQANAILAGLTAGSLRLDFLAGYRYLGLDEDLTLNAFNRDLNLDIQNSYRDRFQASNHFHGGQLGTRASFQAGRLSLQIQGQVALGSTYQGVDRSGISFQAGGNAFAPGPHPGGILTQPTNLGQTSRHCFTVVPATEIKLGIQLLSQVRATVGYDFLYWSSVARASNQVDPVVNPSQSPIFGTGNLAGPARPSPVLESSDFFAHGLTFGLEFRY